MAQLKDTIVSGFLRVTEALLTNKVQTKSIHAPLASDDTSFTPGTSGQTLVSDGTQAHWGNLDWSNIDSKPSAYPPSTHQHAGGDITSGTVSASHGGTGQTSLNASANALINSLGEGTSPAQANDYIVAQYAGGGSVTTTYHRRKLSNIFKALTSSDITTALGYTPPQTDTNTTYTVSTGSVGSASAGTAISADDITSWNAGSVPTLGTAIPADDITAWSAGSTPTLGTALKAHKINSWSAGSAPTLGTAIPADDITAWSAGTLPAATVEGENLTLTFGSLPSLSYTAKSIPNVTNVGSASTLNYDEVTIPNVTSVGEAPSLSYTAKSIPNVTSVGSAPTLEYTARTIPNISVTSTTVVTAVTENE